MKLIRLAYLVFGLGNRVMKLCIETRTLHTTAYVTTHRAGTAFLHRGLLCPYIVPFRWEYDSFFLLKKAHGYPCLLAN